MPAIKRVLIANRGEIALRIIRACHEEGLEAVAVYSAADHGSPHVRAADLAIAVGPSPPSQSYLSIERLIAAALSAVGVRQSGRRPATSSSALRIGRVGSMPMASAIRRR